MAEPTEPRRSQLEDFVATPMGPGLTGDEAPRQSVHPQAPQPSPSETSSRSESGHGITNLDGGAATDPTKQASGERLGSEIAAARIGLGDGELRSAKAGGAGPTAGDVGGAKAAGFGSSLGSKDPDPTSIPPAAAIDGAGDEQSDARLAKARAQSGRADLAAPDQTRAVGEVGSINETDGL